MKVATHELALRTLPQDCGIGRDGWLALCEVFQRAITVAGGVGHDSEHRVRRNVARLDTHNPLQPLARSWQTLAELDLGRSLEGGQVVGIDRKRPIERSDALLMASKRGKCDALHRPRTGVSRRCLNGTIRQRDCFRRLSGSEGVGDAVQRRRLLGGRRMDHDESRGCHDGPCACGDAH